MAGTEFRVVDIERYMKGEKKEKAHAISALPLHAEITHPPAQRTMVCADGGHENLTHRHARIKHRLRPLFALVARAPDNLSSPVLEPPRLSALVTHAGTSKHLVERELFDHLHPCVRGDLVFFDVVRAVPFVVENLDHAQPQSEDHT